MKPIFLLLLVLMTSCYSNGDTYMENHAYFVKFNGHTYINFCRYKATNVIHDPDCPCQRKD